MKKFLIFLMISSTQLLSIASFATETTDVEKNVYYGNISELLSVKNQNCYAKIWLDYIEGKKVSLDSCNICASSFSTSYNCALFSAANHSQNGNSLEAANVLYEFMEKNREELVEYPNAELALQNKAAVLSYVGKNFKTAIKPYPTIFVNRNFKVVGKDDEVSSKYAIDTAAAYSASIDKEKADAIKTQLSTFSGNEMSVLFGKSMLFDKEMPTYYNMNENLIGLFTLYDFQSIVILENKDKPYFQKPLLRDQSNLFIEGDLLIKDVHLKNQNICIDSGSEATVLMPKFYKKIKHKLKSLPILNIQARESLGQMEALGKVVKKSKLKIGEVFYNLSDTPILFRSNSSVICDLILGQDFLSENVKEISLRNRYLKIIRS